MWGLKSSGVGLTCLGQEEEELEALKMRRGGGIRGSEDETRGGGIRGSEDETRGGGIRGSEDETRGGGLEDEQGLGRSGAAAAATHRGMRLPLLIASCLHRRLPVFRLALGGVQRALQEPQNLSLIHI